jgi:hypothetical protein
MKGDVMTPKSRFGKPGAAIGLAATVALAVLFVSRSDAGQRSVPSVVPSIAALQVGSPAILSDQLARVAGDTPGGIDTARVRTIASDLGRFHSTLQLFPSTSGALLCTALVGSAPTDPSMSYCLEPNAPDNPAALRGKQFNVVALYSAVAGRPGIQVFGFAFDSVVSLRARVAGSWHPIPVRDNGFYVDLPGAALGSVSEVEATLVDGSTQTQTVR